MQNTKPNIIVIVIDTLRKDYSAPLERLLKNYGFISYDNAIAPAPWTLPSHASIFAGVYPIQHEVHETKNKKDINIKFIKFKKFAINNILKNMGYSTYLFSANEYVSPFFGFSPFDYVCDSVPIDVIQISSKEMKRLDELKDYPRLKKAKILLKEGEVELIIKALSRNFFVKHRTPIRIYRKLTINWPTEKGVSTFIKTLQPIYLKTPFLLFMNLMEMHEPYGIWDKLTWKDNISSENINQKKVKLWKKKYNENINYLTQKIEKILNILKDKNLWNDSLIIITSDHGQFLGENGKIGHGIFLDDILLKVPLFIKYPENCIIKKSSPYNKFIPLTNLKDSIVKIVQNQTHFNESYLFSSTAFAESYGLPFPVSNDMKNKYRKKIEQLDRYKIALYHKNTKAIFDVSSWSFEKIYNYNNEDISKSHSDLKKLIIKFLSLKI